MKKKTQSMLLSEPHHLRTLTNRIAQLDLSEPWKVTWTPHNRNRTSEQNACFHGWTAIFADHYGEDPATTKEKFKARWVVPIVERDDPEFREQMNLLRSLFHEGDKKRAIRLAEIAKKRVSTTWLGVRQFAEVLDNIEKLAANEQLVLPKREDYEERY